MNDGMGGRELLSRAGAQEATMLCDSLALCFLKPKVDWSTLPKRGQYPQQNGGGESTGVLSPTDGSSRFHPPSRPSS